MKRFLEEVDANFLRFESNHRVERDRVEDDFKAEDEKFRLSYRRITSLQAWRTALLEGKLSRGSLAFFLEAQNDALVSHVLAREGAWRSALQGLRSMIENAISCLFYMDHPVEMRLWEDGKHRLGFSSALSYMEKHPDVQGFPKTVVGLDLLQREYGLLSRAVHASSSSFRMATDGATRLNSSARSSLGGWTTRQRHSLLGVNLMLLTLFRDDLAGSQLLGLRKAISLAIPNSRHAIIKRRLKVNLFK